ncbi:endonuclease MutS2 [Alicyclobacillus acidoterrestris]|uniref:Endonuclease MutS2 n=1 Tax=Alicyclobacillus acidoterrestris (strain ATCC 49025 / DSM 3922 / CIP 106132 / NCIMB 13137 / GD3B) TaxID=1356854 RepID=A0A9E6ZGJ3_ALIAG|nr:endonuclease MutS2 [Alicyclobacillus acidoterrestris]UNO48198.1 endonuclease MutS2 [Alicyclobacillus acidoterrestris]
MLERSLRALEYKYIQEQIAQYAMSSLGKRAALSMQPFTQMSDAEVELQAVDESLRCLLRAGGPPFSGITDIRADLQRAKVGGTLSAERLLAVAQLIHGGRQFRQYVQHAAELVEVEHLVQLLERMVDARRTEQEIRSAIDDDAQVLDNASKTLHELRTERRKAEGQVRTVLDRMLRSNQKVLQEPIIAMRGSHFCLPVRVEHKNQVNGIVRDVSASGSTVYIEPQAVVDISNKVRELEILEEREIERILLQLSQTVAVVADELLGNVEVLETVDLWFAKAGYAKALHAKRPTLTEGVWRLYGARHPQLNRDAVPVDVTLGDDYHLLIVTGPNTGGKTVTLKTIGLLTLMAMSGCFLPTERESEIGFCSDIFVDIGDEQSIEQSLSTFSAHMTNIIHMLSAVRKDSLVLLDELGAGTDPAEGSALAIAILNRLCEVGCRVIATTHYAELKGYAFHNPHAMNASMEFDVESLRPTYRLLVGVPGRSNALAIAARLGLPEDILAEAREHVAETDVHVEELIGKLEQARRAAEQAASEAQASREESERLREQWEAKSNRLEAEAEAIRQRAQQEAARVVEQAQQESEKIIRELRQMRSAAGVKDHQLVELRKSLEGLVPEQRAGKRASASSTKSKLTVGARVRVISLGQKGDIVEVSGDGSTAMVQLGLMRMKVGASDIEVLQEKQQEQTVRHTRKGVAKDIRMELDVRGETVEEAIRRIDKYLDDAVVSGLPRVVIIHGKGTGALRNAVRRHLQHHPQVKSSVPGGQGEGDDGVTVVTVRM